jgi:hypothetical protein
VTKMLIPSDAVPPRLYGSPEIHVQNTLLWPIIDVIGTPTY